MTKYINSGYFRRMHTERIRPLLHMMPIFCALASDFLLFHLLAHPYCSWPKCRFNPGLSGCSRADIAPTMSTIVSKVTLHIPNTSDLCGIGGFCLIKVGDSDKSFRSRRTTVI